MGRTVPCSAAASTSAGNETAEKPERSKSNSTKSKAVARSLPGAPLDKRFTFESFVVGKPNELAYAAARRVAEGGAVSFNQHHGTGFFIAGTAGINQCGQNQWLSLSLFFCEGVP